MKILVVGGGGREHALVWKIAQSPKVDKIYCAPGNGGISRFAECLPIKATDIKGVVDFSKEKNIDLVVVAPDDPLAAGMVDALQDAGIRAFGPEKKAAAIEASKVFSKNLMRKYGIPTAQYEVFDKYSDAYGYLEQCRYPIVVKADGLALGKGVFICSGFQQAIDALDSIMEGKVFGSAGDRVVIEEFLEGQEVSILAFTDGKTLVPMVSSQDHKRAFDNDMGPNTGGMGTFSPSRIYTPQMEEYCMEKIFIPTIEAMYNEERRFKGVLYFGLIITKDGPKVLEYNARFGDPETQVILPRLKTDIIDVFIGVIDEKLDTINIEWYDNAAVCVVMASGGYPGGYQTGYEIHGIDEALQDENIAIFHAGTRYENGKYSTAGGRVLGVTGIDKNLEEARKRVYEAVNIISFTGAHFRKDIGVK